MVISFIESSNSNPPSHHFLQISNYCEIPTVTIGIVEIDNVSLSCTKDISPNTTTGQMFNLQLPNPIVSGLQ